MKENPKYIKNMCLIPLTLFILYLRFFILLDNDVLPYDILYIADH